MKVYFSNKKLAAAQTVYNDPSAKLGIEGYAAVAKAVLGDAFKGASKSVGATASQAITTAVEATPQTAARLFTWSAVAKGTVEASKFMYNEYCSNRDKAVKLAEKAIDKGSEAAKQVYNDACAKLSWVSAAATGALAVGASKLRPSPGGDPFSSPTGTGVEPSSAPETPDSTPSDVSTTGDGSFWKVLEKAVKDAASYAWRGAVGISMLPLALTVLILSYGLYPLAKAWRVLTSRRF